MKKLRFTVALIAAVLSPIAAQATPSSPPPPPPTVCSFNDFTVAAIACRGPFTGNLNGSASEMTDLHTYFGNLWTYHGKSDDAGFGPFTGNPSSTTGTLTFDAPVTGLFVIGLKASNSYSFYEFNGGTVGITSLRFSTSGTAQNDHGIAQDLSHAALYLDPPESIVPEPSTYMLMAAGLAGVGLVSRRRRRNNV